MPAYHDVLMPIGFSYGATGGPGFKTILTTRASGFEDANQEWQQSKAKYDVSHSVKNQARLDELLAFFYGRRGRAYSFGFRDQSDWKSCSATSVHTGGDQILGVGDGHNVKFALIKTYPDLINPYVRKITKPEPNTVIAWVGSNHNLVENTHYTVDHLAGLVVFLDPPPAGWIVSAGYQYRVPVRFDIDELPIEFTTFNAFSMNNVPLVETR